MPPPSRARVVPLRPSRRVRAASDPKASAGRRRPRPVSAAGAGDWSAVRPDDLGHPALYINRELSWLAFNQRVLDQASDVSHPLLERVKFLAIAGTNLDEFFMVRVATLLKKHRAGLEDLSVDGLTPTEELDAIRAVAQAQLEAQSRCWREALRPQLAAEGIHFLDLPQYTPAIEAWVTTYFEHEVYPVLTPLAFDPGHPFPHISNLSMNLAVRVRHSGRTKFARVKVPDVLPRFVPLPDGLSPTGGLSFVLLEDVIRANLQALFPGTKVEGAHLFRVIRDTDMVIQEDEADDLLESVDRGLRQLRYGAPSLLQVDADMPHRVVGTLVENFGVGEDVVVRSHDRTGFGDWWDIARLPRPALKDPPYHARTLWAATEPERVFEQVADGDVLVHHPFDSFTPVETFLRSAVADPHVVAIKMTLYRIGHDSPLVDLLIAAADAGKQVAVLVELKARFDERNNIAWATRLEAAGIHVVYGLLHLKVHGKLCLVVRKEAEGIRRYAHLATGNYNRATAGVYTDIGLFTSDPDVVEDVTDVFNALTGYSNQRAYRKLLVAPTGLRAGLLALIDREIAHARAGRPAGLVIKNNAVTDPAIIRALYRASQAGVDVDLIVRGVCSLRPGIPGISDRIRVRSLVGRFLEHSRLYAFENGGEAEVYFGSADLMERNLDRRVEVICPVTDPTLCRHLREVVLDAARRDTARAWTLEPGGSYRRARPADDAPAFDAQQHLMSWHASHAPGEFD